MSDRLEGVAGDEPRHHPSHGDSVLDGITEMHAAVHARTDDFFRQIVRVLVDMRRAGGFAEIAAQVTVSPRTLARRFKQCTGDSPKTYLQKVRVEAGKALLENTNLRMSEVLERIGYEDESTFRRVFKRHTSLSPRDYRRRFSVSH